LSKEIDTSGGTATKDDVLYLAAREEIPAVKAQRDEVLADMNHEELRKVLAGEVSVDDWDPTTEPEEPETDEGDEGDEQ
jgi:hypothetical protein